VEKVKKVKTSISIDEDVNDAIALIAEEEDRSFSQQLNNILKEFLKNREKKSRE
jgi:hypothetical protein